MKTGIILLLGLAFSNFSVQAKEIEKKESERPYRCCTQTYSSSGADGFTFTATVTACYDGVTQEQAMALACDLAFNTAKAKVEAAKKDYGLQ